MTQTYHIHFKFNSFSLMTARVLSRITLMTAQRQTDTLKSGPKMHIFPGPYMQQKDKSNSNSH